jgi:hypothetical protein
MHRLIAEDGHNRKHGPRLKDLLETTEGPVRIASPYITSCSLFLDTERRVFRILTSLSEMDVISGAVSLKAIDALIETGVECRRLSTEPKFHAKVYIFGDQSAIVTSANFTKSGLEKNIEVGTELTGPAVDELAAWFDAYWVNAQPVTKDDLAELEQRTRELRRAFRVIKSIARKKSSSPDKDAYEYLSNGTRTFLCNTNRRFDTALEPAMKQRFYAAAWERFDFPDHMERVKKNDIILMFAKDVGIVGIGNANGEYEKLIPGDPDRISKDGDTPEWRIPVDWIVWWDDADACRLAGPRQTFIDVTGPQHADLRNAVIAHSHHRSKAHDDLMMDDLEREIRSTTKEYVRLRAAAQGKRTGGSRVYQMLSRYQPVGTIKKLVSGPTDGLTFLCSIKRPELSAEWIALQPRYDSIISDDIRRLARANLRVVGVNPPTETNPLVSVLSTLHEI